MSHTYYALYSITELHILALSGSIFTDIPDGFSMCKVYEKDCEYFYTHKKIMHDYIVQVDNEGYAKFKSKYLQVSSTRKILNDNVIRDLNYQIRFFEFLNIQFTQDIETITLSFDLLLLDEESQTLFNTIAPLKSIYMLYVTEYQNPTELIDKFEIDLVALSESKTLSIPYKTDKQISLWGARSE